MKLNDEVLAVKSNILMMMMPLLNVTQAYRLVAQEQNHKEVYQKVNQTVNVAFVANRKRFLDSYSAFKMQHNSKMQKKYV